jgi:phage tail-like protein
MPKTGDRKDHYLASRFKVEIDSVDSATFAKCQGLKSETEVFEYQEGGNNESVRKLVGQSKANNIVLTKGYVNDPALFAWRKEVSEASTNPIKRRNGSIICLGDDNQEVGRWNFEKAWPVRWELGEMDGHGQAMCEILELAVEKISKA